MTPVVPKNRLALLATLLTCAILFLPATALGAWPGSNGRIVYRALVPGFEAEGQEAVGLAWTTGRRGEAPHQLTADPTDADPQASPDGRLIAFSRQTEAQQSGGPVHSAIFVIRFDQTGLRQLTDPPEECQDGRPSFDPRGKQLFFVRHCSGAERSTATWSIDLHGTHLSKLEGSRARSGAGAISPSGRQVVFLRRTEVGSQLISMRPDGSRRRDLTPRFKAGNQIASPDFSPDGRLLVFSVGSSSLSDLFTMRADGRNLRRLSDLRHRPGSDPPGYGEPAFAPDGREVVATAFGRSGPATLVRFEVGGDGKARGIPHVRYGDQPTWAPRPAGEDAVTSSGSAPARP
jgi:Tol biopolymer transport system component